MGAMARATPAWALLAVASAAAAANVTAADNATAAGGDAAAASPSSPATRLFNTLLITFGAIFLGLVCVRLRLVEPDKGDTKAMGFYIGKIAFPLLIFNTVATADLGNVNLGTVAACNLGKIVVMIVTAILSFFAYKPGREVGQQVLTSAVFAFFTVSSNDFAIGFPVIEALYGRSMAVYIAANALVGSFIFVPVTMVLFSIGKTLKGSGVSAGKAVIATVKEVALNPVITCTVAGLLYKVLLPGTLHREDGKLVLPGLLSKLIQLFTAPFVMSALFLTGTTLRSPRITLWPMTLVLMKVVVCAFVSFLFGQLLVGGTAGQLRSKLLNFTFFYGSIPTSSAPMVFASQYDPGAVELVSTSILLGLVLAGPIMFVTALILSSDHVSTGTLAKTQVDIIGAGLACGGFILVLLAILRREWGYRCPAKKLLAMYAIGLVAYEVLALLVNPVVDDDISIDYGNSFWSPTGLALSWLQNLARLVMLALQIILVLGPKESPNAPGGGNMIAAACIGLSVIVALVVAPNTVDQFYHRDLHTWEDFRLVAGFVWTCLLLAVSLSLVAFSMCRKRQVKQSARRASEASESDSSNAESGSESCEAAEPRPGCDASDKGMRSAWVRQVPKDVLRPISVVFTLTLLTQVVNGIIVLTGPEEGGSFLVMLILESILVHGQLFFLALSIFHSENLTNHAAPAVPRLCPCLRRRQATPSRTHGLQAPTLARSSTMMPDAMCGVLEIPTSDCDDQLAEANSEEDGLEELSSES